jgi:PAS domain S-box-containing protein
MVIFDRSHTVLAFNTVARERGFSLYGKVITVGGPVDVFIRPEAQALFDDEASRAFSGEKIVVERNIPSRSFDDHPYRFTLMPIAEPGQEPWGICFSMEDLGVLHTVKKNLKQRETQYFELLRALPVVVLIMVDQRCRYANDAALAMFGLGSPDELVGLHVSTFIPPEDLGKARERLETAQHGAVNAERETEIVRLDGTRRKLMVQSMHCSYEGQDASLVIARDITEARQKEMWTKLLSYAVEQSPACIVITDPQGTIEYTNPVFTEITGYSAEEAKGQNPRLLKSGEMSQESYRKMWQTISSGEIWHGEFHNVKRNGELYWEDASIGPIKSEDGRIVNYVAVKELITKRKLDEAKLQDTLAAKEALIHELQHRTRNNLQILSALLSMQVDCAAGNGAAAALEALRGRVMALASVQDQILNRDNLSRIDLRSFVDDIIAHSLALHEDSDTRISATVHVPAVDVPVDFANHFGLVLNELVTNSVRHAFPGRSDGTISFVGRLADGVFEFEYRDDGGGIAETPAGPRRDTLGMFILHSMVESQLGGTVTMLPGPGYACRLRIPF